MKVERIDFIRMFFCLFIVIYILGSLKPVEAKQSTKSSPVPILAYYYIWFDSTSWLRAKTDYPQLGSYTSDDRTVMRQHIKWAKAAGIDGFIVSWKNTDVLNRRLKQLSDLAEEENFKLAIIYQGLDFNRDPQPVDQISADLDVFIELFSYRPSFSLFEKPLVILSGTWKFSSEDIAKMTQGRRDNLLLLASERNLEGYSRIAQLVDGNAYYWSSVNPETFPGYKEKLVSMGAAVHQDGGLWIPPAAPGFDARLVGGKTVVERKNGDTFRVQISTAMSSSPDALGIISWNEFSENSHIEPSINYGEKYIEILSEMNYLPSPAIGEFDSSEPSSIVYPEVPWKSRQTALSALIVIIISAFIVIWRRNE